MKKILILAIVLMALGGLYALQQSSEGELDNEPAGTPTSSDFRPNPSNATFTFDDGPITLSQGRNEREIVPGGALTEETLLTDHRAYGDLNNDGRNDTAAVIVRQSGASGIFIYVAAFVSGPTAYKGTNALFVGDRVNPQNISISDGVITLGYLDRDPDEPFAAEPTISTERHFVFRSGELVER